MKNSFKYLATGDDDHHWGLFLNVAGNSKIIPGSLYPPQDHPSGYTFHWNEGRILNEFQINYITEGKGVFETKNGTYPVKAGSLLFVFPGEWHRYKPDIQSGWTENYIGFEGKIARHFLSQAGFSKNMGVLNPGTREEILDTYLKIFDLVDKEPPGFQQISSGLILKLLGYIISFQKQKGFSGKRIAKVIEEVRFNMRKNVEKEVNLQELADQHHVGYSFFRKMFKQYTGVSPGQYQLQLRIIRAKELLLSTDKSIKEISYELGFQSIYYFSNMFKKKVGISPSEFRKR